MAVDCNGVVYVTQIVEFGSSPYVYGFAPHGTQLTSIAVGADEMPLH